MASGAPERPVVLRRLGIIKDENDPAFLQHPPAPVDVAEDGLESFGSETQSGLSLKAIGDRIASTLAIAGRNPWVAVAMVAVVSLIATVLLINVLFGAPEPRIAAAAASAASSNDAPPAADVNPPADTAPANAKRVRAVAPVAVRPSTARSAPASAPPAQNVAARGGSRAVGTETSRRPEARSSAPPTVAAEAVAAAAASSPVPDVPFVDERIYSAEDTDVVPPRTSETLPGPAISAWTTRTNVVELIVSDSGTVERARFVTPPQRMPDVLELSRAKVWKFTPAMKEGRPVRYRLLLKWEVNP